MSQQYGLPDSNGNIKSYYITGQEKNIINHPELGSIINPSTEQLLSAGMLPINIPDVNLYQSLGNVVIEADQITYTVVDNDLDSIKALQTSFIVSDYAIESQIPVTVSGVNYWADIQSALRLDGARRSVSEAITIGLLPADSTVAFTDTNRVEHQHELTDALIVCLAVAGKAQADFTKKQSKIVAIEAATTIEEVKAIVW